MVVHGMSISPKQQTADVIFCSFYQNFYYVIKEYIIKGIACVASVSVRFGSKELRSPPPPPPSYFCSRPIFRASKTPKTPFFALKAPRKRLLCRLRVIATFFFLLLHYSTKFSNKKCISIVLICSHSKTSILERLGQTLSTKSHNPPHTLYYKWGSKSNETSQKFTVLCHIIQLSFIFCIIITTSFSPLEDNNFTSQIKIACRLG